MGVPAVVMGDQITGMCVHLIPGPALGVPQPSPPLPFAAPLTVGLASTVLLGGRPAAVMGSSGFNVPPHVGIIDAFVVPAMQQGIVVQGSATVLFEGRPAALTGSATTICMGLPGMLAGSAATVLVGA